MRQTLAERDHDLSAVREQRIHDQQLLALATLAAGTAHELRTPLSTLRVILKDMQSDHPELDEDLSLMLQQVDCCTDKLRNMTEEVASGKPAPIRLDAFLAQVLESWIVMRPQVSYTLQPLQEPVPIINTSVILQQALLNLLNNAADACPDAITISVHYPEADRVTLRIRDHGPGLSPEQLASMGKPFFTTKGGLGIGLFLTTTSLATQDGEVYLYNHPGGGTLTEVTLKTSGSDLQDTEND
jgi:two-component system sensor histidine kinase RegB